MKPHEEASEPDLSVEIEYRQEDIPDYVIDTIARSILPQMRAYFASPEGQTAFTAWKEKHTRA